MSGFASFDRNLSNNLAGSAWDFGGGTWNLNMGGSGTAYQSATATPAGAASSGAAPNMLLIALAVGAAWLLLK